MAQSVLQEEVVLKGGVVALTRAMNFSYHMNSTWVSELQAVSALSYFSYSHTLING